MGLGQGGTLEGVKVEGEREERFFASLRMTDALNGCEDAEAEEAERGDAHSTLRLGRAEARAYKGIQDREGRAQHAVPLQRTGQWLCVTSAWDALKRAPTKQRLAPVASACASNPMPRTEGSQARRSVRKR